MVLNIFQQESRRWQLTKAIGAGALSLVIWVAALFISFEKNHWKILRIVMVATAAIANSYALWKIQELEDDHHFYCARKQARTDITFHHYAKQTLPYLHSNIPVTEVNELTQLQPQLDLYPWEQLEDEAVGIIIAGNSGVGKTSVAAYLLGLFTQRQPKPLLVLDPHYNKIWKQLGLRSIGKIADIERLLKKLVQELDQRYELMGEGQEDFAPLIVVLDELGKCQKRFQDPKFIEEAIARLGSEGRKVNMLFIVICHSHNVEDMGISKKLRNNYVLILLGASALDQSEFKWKMENLKRIFIESQAYPCLLSGSVRDTPAIHPTHHQYKQFKIKGNEPQNLLPIRALPYRLNDNFQETQGHIELQKSDTPSKVDTDQKQWLESMLLLDIQPSDTWTHPEIKATQNCPECHSINIKGNGHTTTGKPRKRCKNCGKSWIVE